MSAKSKSSKGLEEAIKNADEFEQSIKDLTKERIDAAPVKEEEQQTKLSQNEIAKSKDIYLKPKRTISSKEKFNEKYREDYEFKKEYVCFIAENKEIIGETITCWTKPFAGIPAEEWEIPTNKPVWAPRYLAEQIKNCTYHRFSMQDMATSREGGNTFYGSMVVDNTIQRLDAIPASQRRSVFMGKTGF